MVSPDQSPAPDLDAYTDPRVRLAILAAMLFASAANAQQRPPAQHKAYDKDMNPVAVTEYSAPFIYSVWWGEIASCEGFPVPTQKQQRSVQWFSVASSFFGLDNPIFGMLAGTWDEEPSIYMGAPYVWEKGTVEHEMMHMVLRWNGFEMGNYHPPEIFEVCGIHTYGTVHN